MVLVVKHIVEAHMIHRELVRIADIKAENIANKQQATWMYKPMQYLNPDQEVRRIDFISSIKSFHKVCNQSSCIIRIEDFFKTLRISDAGIEERSITWLELYILYRISGHPRPLDSKPQSIGDRAKQSIPLDL